MQWIIFFILLFGGNERKEYFDFMSGCLSGVALMSENVDTVKERQELVAVATPYCRMMYVKFKEQ